MSFFRRIFVWRVAKRCGEALARGEAPGESGVVSNRRVLYVSVVPLCLAPLISLFLIDAIKQSSVGDILGFSLLLILLLIAFLWCLLYYFNCRIYYEAEGFWVSNILRIKRFYRYDEILDAVEGKRLLQLHFGDRRLRIYRAMQGSAAFFEKARAVCAFPVLRKKQQDIFNGHIKNPNSFVALFWVVVSLFSVGLLCAGVFGYPSPPESPAEERIAVEQYRQERSLTKDLLLLSEGSVYRLFDYQNSLRDPDALLDAIDRGAEFRVGVQYIEKSDYYKIITLSAEGRSYLSLEDTYRHDRSAYLFGMALLAALLLVILVVSGIMVHVGRNADRYSDRIVYLFFRKNNVIK